jgi:hypothetical protein
MMRCLESQCILWDDNEYQSCVQISRYLRRRVQSKTYTTTFEAEIEKRMASVM